MKPCPLGAFLVFAVMASTLAAKDPVVAVPADAPSAVRIAADEFQKYWGLITGRRITITAHPAKDAVCVRIGFPSDDPLFGWETDAYIVKSAGDGLEIAGKNPRSVLYGTYEFFRQRCGCRWFWDGDVVPKAERIDLSGVDIREKAQFLYRGCQYFAHRGLKRFQAEHWGFEDWKKEIDWALKNRLNLIMLRLGIEDLFQLAFPDVVPYPDPDVTEPVDAKEGYNLRTPFWSLQYRHLLRRAVLDYATDRGLMHPVEFGTLTHWFSRTPRPFLEKIRPEPMPQANDNYAEPSGEVWDVRKKKWFDMYWRLTEASIANYGFSGLMFNPGFDERVVFSNREDNVKLKIDVVDAFNREAARRYPDAKLLMEGWDFYFTWKPEEVARFARASDPSRTLVFDFTADGGIVRSGPEIPLDNNFSRWGITNSFPYVFGFMLELNAGNDIRGNYAKIRDREKAIRDDPMCKGYVIWPEASHTDIFAWRYFTDNCWRLSDKPTDALLADFCRDRYGSQASVFESLWKTVLTFGYKAGWSRTLAGPIAHAYASKRNDVAYWRDNSKLTGPIPAREVFARLAELDWTGAFVRRDAMDLARTTADRLAFDGFYAMMRTWFDAKEGRAAAKDVMVAADYEVALVESMADLLALHEDFSIAETLDMMNRVEKVRNPQAEHLLFENAACEYCRSHHAEWARGWYAPLMREIAGTLVSQAGKGDYTELPAPTDYLSKLRAMDHPIRSFAPVAEARTPERWRRVCETLATLAAGAREGQ